MSKIIDTNVPLSIKLSADKPALLVEACELLLEEILESRLPVVTDLEGEIVEEYFHKLSMSGSPSLGDMFAKYVFDHRYTWSAESRPSSGLAEDGTYAILNGDEADFDPSDRKFIAVAKAAGSPIYQAADTKWLDWGPGLARHEVEVRFVHEPSIRQMYRKKFDREAP